VGLRDKVSDLTTKALWYAYIRFQNNYRRNQTHEILWTRAAEDSARFIEENFDDAVIFANRLAFWDHILGKLRAEGELIEVGVFKGASVNYIADYLKRHKDPRLVHGFDAFEGLEEDWSGEALGKDFFDLKGKLPAVRENVRLHQGWVQDTLGPFYAEKGNPKLALVHIDTDTYAPARHILEISKPLLTPGTVIVFDELIGYPNWRTHEFRALGEVLARDAYRFIGFTSRQAAIRIV
jgi:hypothetical protein